MKRNKKVSKALSLCMALALTAGNLSPAAVKADTITVDKNILQGLIPTTNADGGIANPEAAESTQAKKSAAMTTAIPNGIRYTSSMISEMSTA